MIQKYNFRTVIHRRPLANKQYVIRSNNLDIWKTKSHWIAPVTMRIELDKVERRHTDWPDENHKDRQHAVRCPNRPFKAPPRVVGTKKPLLRLDGRIVEQLA